MTYIENNSIKCVEELEQNGTIIKGKSELIERLTEINQWQYGFTSLVKNGERIHITIEAQPTLIEKINTILVKYGFKANSASDCAKQICGLS